MMTPGKYTHARSRLVAAAVGCCWLVPAVVFAPAADVPPSAEQAPVKDTKQSVDHQQDTRHIISVVLSPRREAVLSAEVSGQVVTVHKEMGESFDKGEPLVTLDDLNYRVEFELAEAAAQAAEKELAQTQKLADKRTRERHAEAVLQAAQQNLEATEALFADKHASRLDMENARRDVIVATTELELVAFKTHSTLIEAAQSMVSANAKKTVAEDRLNACVIRGPYGGRVRQVLINEHELVQRGSTAIEVIDDRVLLAKCLFPSAAFGKIELGQPLQMTILETGNMVEATVSHIAAVLDPASGTFDVFAEIDNADGTLRAGMNASMVLDTSARHPND